MQAHTPLRVRWSMRHQKLLESQATAASPEECCGFLFGLEIEGGWWLKEVRPATNVSDAPQKSYSLDGREQAAAMQYADARRLEVIGYYHSHPNGRRGPSPTDFVLAGGDRKFLKPAECAKLPADLQSPALQRLPDHAVHFIVAVENGKVPEINAWQLRRDLSGFDKMDLEFYDDIRRSDGVME